MTAYGVVTRNEEEVGWAAFDKGFYEVKDVTGRAAEPLADGVNMISCFGDTAAVEQHPELAPVDDAGNRATRDQPYFDWAYVCPTRADYRDGVLAMINDAVAANGAVRLDDIGFPRPEYCRCERCERALAAWRGDDPLDAPSLAAAVGDDDTQTDPLTDPASDDDTTDAGTANNETTGGSGTTDTSAGTEPADGSAGAGAAGASAGAGAADGSAGTGTTDASEKPAVTDELVPTTPATDPTIPSDPAPTDATAATAFGGTETLSQERAAWRASVITRFVAAASERIPGRTYLTLYPNPYPGQLYERAGLDLPRLAEYVDEFVVPLYDTNYGTTYWLETIAKGFADRLADLPVEFSIELYAVQVEIDRLIHATEVASEYANDVFFGYEASNAAAALRRMRADERDGVEHTPDDTA